MGFIHATKETLVLKSAHPQKPDGWLLNVLRHHSKTAASGKAFNNFPEVVKQSQHSHKEQAPPQWTSSVLWVHLIWWSYKIPHMGFKEFWNVIKLTRENSSADEWANLQMNACWLKNIKVEDQGPFLKYQKHELVVYSLYKYIVIILLWSNILNSTTVFLYPLCRRPH